MNKAFKGYSKARYYNKVTAKKLDKPWDFCLFRKAMLIAVAKGNASKSVCSA